MQTISIQAQLLSMIGTFIVGVLVAVVAKKLEPKAKVVFWSPRFQLFTIPPPAPNPNNAKLPAKSESSQGKEKLDSDILVSDDGILVQNPISGQPPLVILVTTIFFQNIGNRTAHDIEICYREKPENFKLFPSLDYDEQVTPDGAFIVKLKGLGPKETVALECLALAKAPMLNYVRCNEAICEELLNWTYTRIYPNYFIFFSVFCALIGAGVLASVLILVVLNSLGIYSLRPMHL